MPKFEVQPRQTPKERAFDSSEVDVEPELRHHAEIIEDSAAPRQSWEFQLRELFHVLTTT